MMESKTENVEAAQIPKDSWAARSVLKALMWKYPFRYMEQVRIVGRRTDTPYVSKNLSTFSIYSLVL